ncbi:hypothetical protein [Streptomyces sclerotialus]|uniref:hypothetical protein n=1 Tax=Streptomyces sclerotialus TaxID=1957 RepID=UPI0004CC5292
MAADFFTVVFFSAVFAAVFFAGVFFAAAFSAAVFPAGDRPVDTFSTAVPAAVAFFADAVARFPADAVFRAADVGFFAVAVPSSAAVTDCLAVAGFLRARAASGAGPAASGPEAFDTSVTPAFSAAGALLAVADPTSSESAFEGFAAFALACSPTAESRPALTRPAPLSCALTGVLDTRPD